MCAPYKTNRPIPDCSEEVSVIRGSMIPLVRADRQFCLRIERLHIVIIVVQFPVSGGVSVCTRQMEGENGVGSVNEVDPIIRIRVRDKPIIIGSAPNHEVRHSVPVAGVPGIDKIILREVIV